MRAKAKQTAQAPVNQGQAIAGLRDGPNVRKSHAEQLLLAPLLRWMGERQYSIVASSAEQQRCVIGIMRQPEHVIRLPAVCSLFNSPERTLPG